MQPGAHYGHQVAGHGVLQLYGDAHIAKPKVDREYVFYERAQKTPDLAFVSKWMPSYFGIVRSSEKEYVILEDLLFGMQHPSVLDIKLGKRTFADDASPEKQHSMRQKALASTTHSLGFRISGMKIYNPLKHSYVVFDKIRCRQISAAPAQVTHGFQLAFSLAPPRLRSLCLELIISGLSELLEDLQDLHATLYSSSLLIAFCEAPQGASAPLLRMKIIDFAHSQWEDGQAVPQDYLEGVSNLRECLMQLIS